MGQPVVMAAGLTRVATLRAGAGGGMGAMGGLRVLQGLRTEGTEPALTVQV